MEPNLMVVVVIACAIVARIHWLVGLVVMSFASFHWVGVMGAIVITLFYTNGVSLPWPPWPAKPAGQP